MGNQAQVPVDTLPVAVAVAEVILLVLLQVELVAVVLGVKTLVVVKQQLTWVAVAVVLKAPEVINMLVVLEAPVLLLFLILTLLDYNYTNQLQ